MAESKAPSRPTVDGSAREPQTTAQENINRYKSDHDPLSMFLVIKKHSNRQRAAEEFIKTWLSTWKDASEKT